MPSVNFLPFLQTIPATTKAVVGTILVASLGAFFLAGHSPAYATTSPNSAGQAIPWLVLVPGVSWMYPWTLLTAGLIELTFIEVGMRESGEVGVVWY